MVKNSLFIRTALSAAVLSASGQLFAAHDPSHNPGMIEALTGVNINDASFLQNTGIEVGGWLAAGATYSSHNRSDRDNAPLSFNDRNNELLLNQINLFAERAVTTGTDEWSIGGRIDVMFGADAQNTQAAGWDSDWTSHSLDGTYYDIAVPQLYAEIYAPIGNGITAKVGHFYTSIGYEVVTAPDNFFYSHAYTMLYAEPFTHNGVSLSYDISDNFSINGGIVQGWDNVDGETNHWSFLGGFGWTSDDEASSVFVQLISGNNDFDDDSKSGSTNMYSIVATHDFSDKLHYVFQHDFGQTREGKKNDWYGINQYLTYDLSSDTSVGARLEWFGDKGGAGRVNATGANYYALAVGLNYSPNSWIKLRPEIRIDRADEEVFNGNTDKDQFSIAMDAVITF